MLELWFVAVAFICAMIGITKMTLYFGKMVDYDLRVLMLGTLLIMCTLVGTLAWLFD